MPPTLASIAAPAPVAAPAAPVAVVQQNPKQKAAVERGLAETNVSSVRVDGLALMQILKHAHQAHQFSPAQTGSSQTQQNTTQANISPAVGQLLGIDSDGILEISNAFALPDKSLENDAKTANKYSQTLLPRLNDLSYDASLVGFYASTTSAQILSTPGLVDALVHAQVSGGGVGSGLKTARVGAKGPVAASKPTGQAIESKKGKGIILVYDTASSSAGYVSLKAYRLSPAFVSLYLSGNFTTSSLINSSLVPTSILVPVPVTIRPSPLLTAFLSTLPAQPQSSFAPLQIQPQALEKPVTSLLSALETHSQALSTLSFQTRQLARKKKDGALAPGEDEEPSRRETMEALVSVRGAADELAKWTGAEIVRGYGAKAGVEV